MTKITSKTLKNTKIAKFREKHVKFLDVLQFFIKINFLSVFGKFKYYDIIYYMEDR